MDSSFLQYMLFLFRILYNNVQYKYSFHFIFFPFTCKSIGHEYWLCFFSLFYEYVLLQYFHTGIRMIANVIYFLTPVANYEKAVIGIGLPLLRFILSLSLSFSYSHIITTSIRNSKVSVDATIRMFFLG